MGDPQVNRTARRLAGTILLVLAPFPLSDGLTTHTGHAVGQAETPILTDASHAGEADHWEAVNAARANRCPACLARAQTLAMAPASLIGQIRAGAGSAAIQDEAGPPDTNAGRSQRPRAPPPPGRL